EFIRYQSAPHPQRLDGIYAGFFIDEVSIVAVPDAIQRPWRVTDSTEPGLASPPSGPDTPKLPSPPEGPFRECDPCILSAPVVTAALSDDRIHLQWPADPSDPQGETTYTVEEAVAIGSSFTDWTII